MKKRLFAALIALILSISLVNFCYAETVSETVIDAILLPSLNEFESAGTAVQSGAISSASMYLEYVLHQARNGEDADGRALWNDCAIARQKSDVLAVYDTKDSSLLFVYSTIHKTLTVAEYEGAVDSFTATRILEAMGCSSIHTIDGDDWTDLLQQAISLILNKK